jgi:hypothetical protein
MSLDAYIPQKRVNIKGKRNRRSRRNRARWNNTSYRSSSSNYLVSVSWSYKPNPLSEIIYYVPYSTLNLLLENHIKEKKPVETSLHTKPNPASVFPIQSNRGNWLVRTHFVVSTQSGSS